MFLDELDAWCPWLRLPDRAELLGAVYGDGSMEKRGQYGFRVSVAVSDELPAWLERVPELFTSVFGYFNHRKRRGKRAEWNHEFYVTVQSLPAVFGVEGKYATGHHIRPPSWVENELVLPRFLRGLSETDGSFKLRSGGGDRNVHFKFAQNDEVLSAWLCARLLTYGYDAAMCRAETGMHYVEVDRREHVKRLGEWLQSYKWAVLVDGSYNPRPDRIDRRTGNAVQPIKVTKPRNLSDIEWKRWQSWRRQGASFVAIGRHVGRSNSVVRSAVGNIVPEFEVSAEELGLKPQPRLPKPGRVAHEEVERWRAAVAAGKSARAVAICHGRKSYEVSNACADIQWDLKLAKKSAAKAKLVGILNKEDSDDE